MMWLKGEKPESTAATYLGVEFSLKGIDILNVSHIGKWPVSGKRWAMGNWTLDVGERDTSLSLS